MVAGLEFLTREELLHALRVQDMDLWQLTPNAWALTEIMHTRYGRTLNVLTIVGTRAEWGAGLAALENVARAQGCGYIYSVGHPGWRKLLEAAGWQCQALMRMTKEIDL